MLFRRRFLSVTCGLVLAAGALGVAQSYGGTPDQSTSVKSAPATPRAGDDTAAPAAQVAGIAEALDISRAEARQRLHDQEHAHATYKRLPASVREDLAGHWFEADSGKLAVAVTTPAAAKAARVAGAEARLVERSQAELDQLVRGVRRLAGRHVDGLSSFGVDVRSNDVLITIDRTKRNAETAEFLQAAKRLGGVRVALTNSSPVQQAGEVNPGDIWYPNTESPCSVGFGATDASGGKHFLTAGHCTNDANQPAYAEASAQNKIGTSNVGGSRSVNAREGDMGVVAITEPGWTLAAAVNTYGSPAVTVTGSAEAIVGEAVCHSGKTSPYWECGTVTRVDQEIDYGFIVGGLTITTACSQGGDSGGAWLRGDKAVGLHEGGMNGNSCPTGENAIFQPVNEALTKWGLTLFTGAGDPGDDEPPTAPGSPRSTAVTSTTVSLAWDASVDNVGVTGYDVLRGTTVATTSTSTSATVTGLSPNTEYSFTVQARDAAGNKSKPTQAVTVKTSSDGGGGRTVSNETDYPIRDFQVTTSSVSSTAAGAAATPVAVKVTATHSCQEDLQIGVRSPSGRYYQLKPYGDNGWNCTPFPSTRTFTFTPAASEVARGTWQLRIGDNGPGDTGVLSGWSITV